MVYYYSFLVILVILVILVKVVHQFFDLTPADCVRGLITEQGIISPETIGTAWNKFVSMFDSVS